ncbi:hypothetical protein EDB80DRAFT_745995 [Ilyonectria destructans]|nr:hypothetical protein EDB80DRAFT_745995 [Ilyonectria destructans]
MTYSNFVQKRHCRLKLALARIGLLVETNGVPIHPLATFLLNKHDGEAYDNDSRHVSKTAFSASPGPTYGTIRRPAVTSLAVSSFSAKCLRFMGRHQRRFVIIILASKPSPDLCKLISSAISLGYPSPILISSTLEYLDQVILPDANKGDRLHNNDLVLVVDAYDVRFQLPLSILLYRYHESNRNANARLARQWGASSDSIPMKQTIVVSAQKRCYPTAKASSNLHCDILPASDLSPDIYSAKTDSNAKDYHYVRPRFLNSGSFMGSVGDMKKYFRRVKDGLEKGFAADLSFPGDQGIFGEIFGEQEVWRQWRRGLVLSNSEGTALIQRDFEYHVGLDYSQNPFLPTVYEEDDGRFVSLNNKSDTERHYSTLDISSVRLLGVSKDLATAKNPLADLPAGNSSNGVDWGEMPLYADFFTTAVPVGLHHNAWRNGLKGRRIWWWDQTWYFPYLRQLLKLRFKPGKLRPLARLPAGQGHLEYLAPISDAKEKKPRLFKRADMKTGLSEVELDTICQYGNTTEDPEGHWYDEVFRNNEGPI